MTATILKVQLCGPLCLHQALLLLCGPFVLI